MIENYHGKHKLFKYLMVGIWLVGVNVVHSNPADQVVKNFKDLGTYKRSLISLAPLISARKQWLNVGLLVIISFKTH